MSADIHTLKPPDKPPCPHCDKHHPGVCSRIGEVHYYDDGETIECIVYRDPAEWLE